MIHQPLIWYVYQQNIIINERFTFHTDIQERYFVQPLKQSQFLIRSVLKIHLKQKWDIGPGFAFFLSNKDASVDYNLETPEVRHFLEINNKQILNRVNITHRYRLESRFFRNTVGKSLADGFQFRNMRFRYTFGLEVLLLKPKEDKHALKFKLSDEIMINFGKKITYNIFDQNRVSVALIYAPIKAVAVEVDI